MRRAMDTDHSYVVLASHLPLDRLTATVRFFRAVSAIRKQLVVADGLVGYTLRAQPLARRYWTLSVWTDDPMLQQFVRDSPHREVMGSIRPYMGATRFAQWEIAGSEGRPTWADALDRLAPA